MSLTLVYSSTTVILPNPSFGDIKRFTSQRIFRKTKGGNRKSFKDPDWPVVENFPYQIERLNETQRDDFLDFLIESLGKQVTITDHYGIPRTGYIVTPSTEIITVREDGCSFDASFEFMANQITFLTGECEGSTSIVSPAPGATGDYLYNKTLDDGSWYQIQDEDDNQIDEEDDATAIQVEGY